MKSYLAAVLAAAFAVSPAAAQSSSFTGFRIEGHLGFDKASVTDTDVPADSYQYRFDDSGLLYGVGAGYDFDFGRVVAGVEANLDFSEVSEGATATAVVNPFCSPQPCAPVSITTEFEMKRDVELSARVGARIGAAGLIYGKLGYSNARAAIRVTAGGAPLVDDSGNIDGLRLGAGYEHSFGTNAYGKVEYRFTNYDGDLERSQLLAGVGFRF